MHLSVRFSHRTLGFRVLPSLALILAFFVTGLIFDHARPSFAAGAYAGPHGSDPFVLLVKTDNPGNSNSNQYTIPVNSSKTYNYNVDCDDDGNNDYENVTTSVTCTYPTSGTYSVAISGTYPHFYNFWVDESQKILEVQQWGTQHWDSMQWSFYFAYSMNITATDSPDLSGVTDMTGMFYGARSMNANLNSWDTSNVTNMSSMFHSAMIFNQPLDNWDVSNVTNISTMFTAAYAFNQNINSWDTSSVDTADLIFQAAREFNQPLDNWDVSGITDALGMFDQAAKFNQDISSWDMSNVTRMESMFSLASAFNQPLDNWDTSNVTNMRAMFLYANTFNQSLNGWDTSNVTDMTSMFRNTNSFNGDIGQWDTSSVTNMTWMFYSATAFNSNINDWDTSSVTNMYGMFSYADNFDQPLSNWDMRNVTTITSMFYSADAFNQNINSWELDKVTSFYELFAGAQSFNQPLDNWDTHNVTNMSYTFSGTQSFNQPLNGWDVSSVTNMSSMFSSADDFDQPLDSWDVSNVTTMSSMFSWAPSFNHPLNSWETSSLTDTSHMFSSAQSFNQPLDSWDVSNVTTMYNMFNNADSFNQPLTHWDMSHVVTTSGMFTGTGTFNQPLDSWDMSHVSNMSNMFYEATSFNQSLAAWDMTGATSLSGMLAYTTLTPENYDDTLISWSEQPLRSNVEFGAYNLNYCTSTNERQYLISQYNWSIYDSGHCVPLVTTANPYNITQSSAYTSIALDNRGYRIQNFGLQYGTDTSYSLGTIDVDHEDIPYYFTYINNELTNLECGTTYHYRAYAIGERGDDYGEDKEFTTGACDIPETSPVIETGDATSISRRSVTLHANVLDLGNPAITDVWIELGTDTNYGTTLYSYGVDQIGTYEISLTDSLTCATTYHYRAYSVNSQGYSYGEDKQFTTSACADQADLSITVELLNTTAIHSGDTVNYAMTITNNGPGIYEMDNLGIYVNPPLSTTYTSSYVDLDVEAYGCNDMGEISSLGGPVATYQGRFLMCGIDSPETTLAPNQHFSFSLTFTATNDFADGSEIFRSALFTNAQDDDMHAIMQALTSPFSPLFAVSNNNVYNATYEAPSDSEPPSTTTPTTTVPPTTTPATSVPSTTTPSTPPTTTPKIDRLPTTSSDIAAQAISGENSQANIPIVEGKTKARVSGDLESKSVAVRDIATQKSRAIMQFVIVIPFILLIGVAAYAWYEMRRRYNKTKAHHATVNETTRLFTTWERK